MKLGIVFLCVAFGWIQAAWNSRAASALDLREFLPYQRASSSSLISTTGTGFEFDFYSPMRDNEFYWRFRKGTMQRRTNFRNMQLRTDAAGLSVFADFFYDPLLHGNTFSPAWLIAPALVTEGQVISSSASLTPSGLGSEWSGTVIGLVTIGNLETNHSPAGKVAILPLTFRYDWEETGPGSRGTGVVVQTWWMTREIGVFKVEFTYEETDTNGVTVVGSDRFHLRSSTLLTSSPAVTFPDPNLEAAVRTLVPKPSGDVTASDLSPLLDFTAPSSGITDLTGLEYAYQLVSLRLASNGLTDLSPLESLTKLTTLDLAHNQVKNLEPLRGLTNLFYLTLTRNGLADLSPLAGLTRLRWLIADENEIADISVMTHFPDLQSAVLGANQIRDVRPLAGLTALTLLEVEANLISDLTPLVTLNQLRNASVEENCLDVSPGTPDRLVIEGWIRNRTRVEDEWVIQNDCSSAEVRLSVWLEGGSLSFSWRSVADVSYRIEMSDDLSSWGDAHPDPFLGTGAILLWSAPDFSEPHRFYRLRHPSSP